MKNSACLSCLLLAAVFVPFAQGQVCTAAAFFRYPNSNVQGGSLAAGVSTLANCETACQADATCVGFDLTTSNQCWLTRDVTATINIGTVSGVDHYRLQKECLQEGNQFCIYTEAGRGTFNAGTTQSGVSTQSACEDTCFLNTNCLGFDFNTAGNVCRHLLSADPTLTADTASPTTSVAYYRDTCSACPAYRTVYQMEISAANGAVPRGTLTTLDTCRASCAAAADCAAFNFNPTNNACSFYLGTGNIGTLQTAATNNVLYQRVCSASTTTTGAGTTSASTGCQVIWTFANDTSYGGGAGPQSASDLAACQAVCVADANCVAIDVNFNDANSFCWTHTATTNVDSNRRDTPGVFHYTITDRCFQPCTPSFTIINDRSSGGANLDASATTLEACQTVCINNDMCVAIDVDFGQGTPQCWVHTNAADLTDERSTTGINQYVIARTCAQTSATTTAGLTTTDVTVSTTAACQPVWTLNNDTSSGNGVARTFTTSAECLAACAADTNCVAADVDFNGGTLCWHHLDVSNLADQRSTSGVFQYVLAERCASTTPTTAAPVCEIVWDIRNDTSSSGGSPKTFSTLEECLSQCVSDENCVAADIDFSGSTLCWHHTDANNLNEQRSSPGVFQYFLVDRCRTQGTTAPACVPEWNTRNNTNSQGGQANSAADMASCLAACIADTNCVGADIDFNGGTLCWLHLDAANLQTTAVATGVFQYVLVDRCPTATTQPTCVPVWEITQDFHAFNGVEFSGATTAEECLAACVADLTCLGVDVDLNANALTLCWFHRDAANFADTEALTGVTLYRLIDRCPQQVTTAVPTPPPTCVPSWTIVNDTHAFGGTERTDLLTMTDCLNACVADISCVGVDLDFAPGNTLCWLHLSSSNLADTGPQTQTYLYILVDRCPTVCTPVFGSRPGEHAFNGIERTDLTTEAACLDACATDLTCVAVDIDLNEGSTLCWFHTDIADLSDLGTQTGVTLRILESRCDGVTTQQPLPEVCAVHEYLDTNANGGQNMGVTVDAYDCMARCYFDTNCLASDYDRTTGQCFYHSTLGARITSSCCTRYERICLPGGCLQRFEPYANTFGSGALFQVGITSLAGCQEICLANSACQGISFRRPQFGPLCYIYTNRFASTLVADAQIDSYARVRCITPDPVTTPTPTPIQCVGDLVFLLDESGVTSGGDLLVAQNNFNLMKQFVRTLVSGLTVGPELIRISVITYSNNARVAFDLDDYTTFELVSTALDAVTYRGGTANIPAALATTSSSVLQAYSGDRPTVANTVIFVTASNNPVFLDSYLPGAASSLRASATVWAIGVGSTPSTTELNTIASSASRAIRVADATALQSAINVETLGVCQGVTPAPVTPAPVTPAPVTPAPVTPAPVTPAPPTPGTLQCLLDLVIVVDGSGSINDEDPGNFDLVRNFLKRLLDVLENQGWLQFDVRVGLITFGSRAFQIIQLNNGFTTSAQFYTAIDNMPYDGGDTNTVEALRQVDQQMFTIANGDRADVRDVVLLITDGRPTIEVENLGSVVQALKRTGTRIVGVGVTSRVNVTIMEEIVSAPLNSNYFPVTNFTSLLEELTSIVTGTCQEITTQPPPVLRCSLDLLFNVDSSGSINDRNPNNWNLTLRFLADVMEFVNISDTRVGMIRYSNQAFIPFQLDNTFTTKQEYQNAILATRYDGGTTNTTGALRAARTQVFISSRGDRPNIQNFMIVLTDGNNTVEVDQFAAEAQRVKDSGIRVMALGITDSIARNQLDIIASVASDGSPLVYEATDFNVLTNEIVPILEAARSCDLA